MFAACRAAVPAPAPARRSSLGGRGVWQATLKDEPHMPVRTNLIGTNKRTGRRLLRSLLLMALVATALPAHSGKKVRARAEALFQRAMDITGSPEDRGDPYLLRGRLKLTLPDRIVEGEYVLSWNAPEQWREEYHLPDDVRTRVANRDTLWESGPRDPLSVRITELHEALAYSQKLRLLSAARPVKVRASTIDEQRVDCVTVRPDWGGDHALCFDADDGFLRLIGVYGRTTLLSDYVRMDDHFFPRGIVIVEQGTPTVDAHLDELVLSHAHDANRFDPVPDSRARPWCAQMQKPEFSKGGRPPPVDVERLEFVTVDVILNVDGRIEAPVFLSRVPADVERQVLQHVDSIRYKPARCGENHVPYEMRITWYTSQVRLSK
jgi:hypothetical protein